MSANNGVIRIGRKGIKKFAFGEDGGVFEVDVVVAFQDWIATDESLREVDGAIPTQRMTEYHQAAVEFAGRCAGNTLQPGQVITTAEALDFIARLREQYDELAVFFRPRSRDDSASPATSEAGLRFSVEGS